MASNPQQDEGLTDASEAGEPRTSHEQRDRDALAIRFATLALGALLVAWVIALGLFAWWVVSSLVG